MDFSKVEQRLTEVQTAIVAEAQMRDPDLLVLLEKLIILQEIATLFPAQQKQAILNAIKQNVFSSEEQMAKFLGTVIE